MAPRWKILIVEDEKSLSDTLVRLLSGHELVLARCQEEAYDFLKSQRFHVVFLDNKLPVEKDSLLDKKDNVGLSILCEIRKQKLGTFSGGMKQRFGIAQALLGNPKLIIVDEPTAGLDPTERNRFHNILSEIGENIVVILSTHIVEDVSDLCTQMAIISHGEVILTGEPLKIINELQGKIWKKTIKKDEIERYQENFKVISTQLFAGKRIIHVYSDTKPDPSFKPVEPDLKDVYFSKLLENEFGTIILKH